jgi:HEPN domain-containing protein
VAKGKRSKRLQAVRRFRLAAGQRLEEARFLLTQGRFTTASIYLAGYSVECALKALILHNDPPATDPDDTERQFVEEGAKSHNFDWLKQQLYDRGVRMSDEAARLLSNIRWWSTDLRYSTQRVESRRASNFLAAAQAIREWAEGRI